LIATSPIFRIQGTLWEGRTLYDLYGEAYTPWEWHPKLKECRDRSWVRLIFDAVRRDCSSIFSNVSTCRPYKVASFENGDIPLLRCIARTGKPIILSTGMATLPEIDEAVQTITHSFPTR